jgi:hypothetical protein
VSNHFISESGLSPTVRKARCLDDLPSCQVANVSVTPNLIVSGHGQSLPTTPSIQAGGNTSHDRVTNRCFIQNGLNSLHPHAVVAGGERSGEVLIHFSNDLDVPARKRSKYCDSRALLLHNDLNISSTFSLAGDLPALGHKVYFQAPRGERPDFQLCVARGGAILPNTNCRTDLSGSMDRDHMSVTSNDVVFSPDAPT